MSDTQTPTVILDLEEVEVTWTDNDVNFRSVCWIPKIEGNHIGDMTGQIEMLTEDYDVSITPKRTSALAHILINQATKAAMDNREGTTLKNWRELEYDKFESDCDGWQLDHQYIIDAINDDRTGLALKYASDIMIDGSTCEMCLWNDAESCRRE